MGWFNNLKVRNKVILASVLFLTIILVISIIGTTNIISADEKFKEFYSERFVPVRRLNRILQNLLQIRINMIQELLHAEAGEWDEVEKRMKSSGELTEKYQDEWKKVMKIVHNTAEAKRISSEWIELTKAAKKTRTTFARYIEEGRNDPKKLHESKKYLAQWKIEFGKLRDKTKEFIVYFRHQAEKLEKEVGDSARQAVIMGIVMLIIALILTVVVVFILSRAVSGPVNKGLDFAKLIAAGDFTKRIELDQKDELGQLGAALNTAADNLEELVSNVSMASQNLTTAVEQIASGNQNLSQRTSEQASSLEEVASTIEETTATVNQNADNSNKANEMSAAASKLAENGGEMVNDAVLSINEINETSAKIGEIITVINDIAFQTNLLALNAAVEAARAGEQGRGFAVVAGEVRNLAQRSGNAAKEIGDLIKESLSKIEVGTEKANNSGQALSEIIGSINNVNKMINEITAASVEQKQGMSQINIAITELDTMTQQNAALVEETASASEEMSNQAQELMGMMSKFRIKESAQSQKHAAPQIHIHEQAVHSTPAEEAKPKKDTGEKGEHIRMAMEDEGFEEF